jgi:parallel beta-helix repeat protein
MFSGAVKYFFIVGAVVGSLTFNSRADAGNCGGNIPCSCGDNVVADRGLLSGVDPVVGGVCPGDGLIMNVAGVILDLNGNALHGSGNGAGVLISGVNGVTIESGQIFNFGVGISTGSNTTIGSTINAVKPDGNVFDGIFLQGDENELIAILAKRNGNNGVTVIGNDNLLQGHNDEYSGFHGIFVQGNGNRLIANLASENAKDGPGNGILVEGDGNTLERNRMTKQNTDGIVVVGDNNTLRDNQVAKQFDDGIVVDGNSNVLTNNRATDNKGVGIVAVGSGVAADSQGNTVRNNRGKPQCNIYGATGAPTCIQK